MTFKLDENIGRRTVILFRQAGHEADTVCDEGLAGCPDSELFQICVRQARSLVTLDLDFAEVLRFDPKLSAGVAVIRLPKNPSLALKRLVADLWIVEPGRIRVHGETGEG
jgi:predicted nuclease of predicted toxin-antitoxin system